MEPLVDKIDQDDFLYEQTWINQTCGEHHLGVSLVMVTTRPSYSCILLLPNTGDTTILRT